MDVAMEEPPIQAIAADSSSIIATNINIATTTSTRIAELNKATAITTTKIDEEILTNSTMAITTSAADSSTTTTTMASAAAAVADQTIKTQLKRCLSVPIIGRAGSSMTLRSAAAAAATKHATNAEQMPMAVLDTPKKQHATTTAAVNQLNHINHGIPRSNPCSREVSPAPVFNIFAPRARRYSASFSPLGTVAVAVGSTTVNGAPLYLTPRVTQLRQEECTDVNTREINHEREVHSAMQMSQSWEDLTLVAENWSCKSDEFSNPLQVALPASVNSCSSPSPTNNRAGLRLPYGLSPSPTRRTFATRRSMSPIAMRPSQLGPVKRKFDLEDQNTSNWSIYSPPPMKKVFTESRGTSPICQSPSSVCPSPDSGTYDGRITPKLFISKLCTANTTLTGINMPNNNCNSNSSTCSSPSSNSSIVLNLSLGKTNSLPSAASGGSSEPLCIGSSQMDEGISISDSAITTSSSAASTPLVTSDLQDEATMMDDTKSETSSIGGCSSISMESTSSNSFFNKFNSDSELGNITSSLVPKHFFINKLSGLSGAKKYIVNHDHSDSNLSVSSTTTNMGGSAELLEGSTPPTIIVDNKN